MADVDLIDADAGKASASKIAPTSGEYALVAPDASVTTISAKVDPSVSTRQGYAWLPVVDIDPAPTPGAPIKEGPVVTVYPDRVERVWTIRAKTAGEMDADKENTLDRVDALQLKVSLDMENRVRVLEGKQPVTAAQYRAALKARL